MNRLIKTALLVAERGRGKQSDRACNLRSLVGENVAEHIGRYDYVKTRGIAHELHCRIVYEHIRTFNLRIFLCYSVYGFSPKARSFKYVCLVDGNYIFATLHCGFKRNARNSFNFHNTVSLGIICLGAVFALTSTALTEVDTAGKLAHDNEVKAALDDVGA